MQCSRLYGRLDGQIRLSSATMPSKMTGAPVSPIDSSTGTNVEIEAEIEKLWKKRCKLSAEIARKDEMISNHQALLGSDRLIAETGEFLEAECEEMKRRVERLRMEISCFDRSILSLEDELDPAEYRVDLQKSPAVTGQQTERGEQKQDEKLCRARAEVSGTTNREDDKGITSETGAVDRDTAERHWPSMEMFEGLRAEKWEERAEELKRMARETREAESRVQAREERAKEVEGEVNGIFRLEWMTEIALRHQLHSMNEEIETGRWQVASRKMEIVEALSRWKEEVEAEKVECEEEIAERERLKELLEGPLRNMAELLDSNWLHAA